MDDLIRELTATGIPFAAYGWSKAPKGDYGVFSLDGANDLIAAGRHVERATRLTVDLFTRAIDIDVVFAPHGSDGYETPPPEELYTHFEHNPKKEAVEAALERVECAWYLNSVQFEDDTGFVHFEWVVEVL